MLLLLRGEIFQGTLLASQQTVLIVQLDANLNLSNPVLRETLHTQCEARGLHYAFRSDVDLLVWADGSYPVVPGSDSVDVTNKFTSAVAAVSGVGVASIIPYTFNFVFP